MVQSLVPFLLVEDDDVDVEMFRRALRKHHLEIDLQVTGDGAAALRALRSETSRAADTTIVLDLNMPGMNGHEFLEELRMDAELHGTTVFVLTSSGHQRDIDAAYQRHVAGYFLKSEIHSFMETLSQYLATTPGEDCNARTTKNSAEIADVGS